MPVTKHQIKKEMQLVHPDQMLSSESVKTIQFLLEELSEMTMSEMTKYLEKEVEKYARSEYNKVKVKCERGDKKYTFKTEEDIEKLAQKEAINYVIAEILELSGNTARYYRKLTINNYHLWKAIYDDKELLQTFGNLNKLPRIPMNIEEDPEAKKIHGDDYEFSYQNIETHLYITSFGLSDLCRVTIHNMLILASNVYNTPEKIKNKIANITNCDPNSLNDNYTISNIHELLIKTLANKINENEARLYEICSYKSLSYDALCEAIEFCGSTFDYLICSSNQS